MRLHLLYKRDAFPEPILALTDRFMELKPWKKDTEIKVFNIWAHGAALAWDLPECDVVFNRHPAGIGVYVPETEDSVARIELHKPSVVSFFHQFRHHMQANADYKYKNEEAAGTDAQAWACSLYYVTNPTQFRKAVRRGLIVGVDPDDLLKTRKKAA